SPSQLIKGPGEASKIGYPVAAKIVSGDIAHKTEAGGIVLNIADDAALDDASARILASARESFPDAEISGILLQPMESGLAEALVGYRDNPETGPIAMVGVGGVLAEIYADVAIRLAPVDKAAAREMIDEVKGMAPIRGYRGLPEGDCAALADAIVRLSTLALVPGEPVMEAEINPVIVRRAGEGVVAVDGLVALKEA
ncbi:MAG: acetate--CoA ligase family protein, partial [Pseudomonadota bacterium]|nr:acetate--CoA ligase family protein [Pseudomonadota bacterium]